MFLQFLKFSFRLFFKERIYSVLNILGLSTGISVALIIFLYLQDDLNYDRYHINAKNIYRVNSIYISSGKENKFALSPASFGPKIIKEFPEVKAFTRMQTLNRGKLSYGDKKFYEEKLVVADSTFFEIFTTEFISGNSKTCFRLPNSIVLTQKLSRKYFGDTDPLGKIMILDKTQTFEVTGVIRDPPENLHARYDALIPVKYYDPKGAIDNSPLYDINVYTYLLMPDNYDTRQFDNKFPAFYEKYAAQQGKALNQQYKAVIQPFTDIHFSKEWSYDLPNGNKTYITAFLIIGLMVLILSGINYLNLTTARSERRRKEISMKKILGSRTSGMVTHFLGESVMTAGIAMVLALVITWLILGYTSFDQLIEKDIKVELTKNPILLAGVIILTIIVGLGSGIYPAFYLSNIHPLKSLQNFVRPGIFPFSLRKLLVIIQLVISVGVVIFTLTIDHQIRYLGKIDIGINKENLLIIPVRDTAISNHINSLIDKLMLNPSIESVTTAHSVPAEGSGNNLYRAETENGLEENNFYSMWVSYDFINTLGIKLLSGRNFSRDYSSDFRSSFIINEKLAKKMGWKEPVGKRLQQRFGSDGAPYFDGVVIGVVKDFNYASLHNAIEPLVLRLQGQEGGRLLLKLNGSNMKKTMEYIEDLWSGYSDEFPTDYTFLDKNYEKLYKKDKQQNMLVKIFSFICILISILGLISLASYITKNKTKEIAIRKVYGASAGLIMKMLYREIIVLVVISAAIAIPLAYYFADKILNTFAYKAGFNISIFLFTFGGAILLVLGTVSYHSLKAAWMNPSVSLRYE